MKKIVIMFALMGAVFGEDLKKAEEPKNPPATMTDVQSRDITILQLQDFILSLKEQIADRDKQIIDLGKQLQKLVRDNTIKGICEDKKVPVEQCSIDPVKGQVTAKPLPTNPAQ